jgi:ABC-2 type transport system ATP-binding protein
MKPAIITENLVKIYKERSHRPIRALDGLSLEVRQGEVFGLLGRNGAGKTTLLKILTTLLTPNLGRASILGFDVVKHPLEVRRRICAVLQENAVEMFLSVEDNLITYAMFHGIPREEHRARIDRVVELFGLAEHRKQKVIDLSGGLKRRVQVAKVFMLESPVVFLDEATTGMDPLNKRTTLDAIREVARQGRTLVLTTHILQEAEELCDRIAIIDHGTCLACGDLPMIKSLAADAVDITVAVANVSAFFLQKVQQFQVLNFRHDRSTVTFTLKGRGVSALDVVSALNEIEPVLHFEVTSASLEDVFISLLDKGKRYQ